MLNNAIAGSGVNALSNADANIRQRGATRVTLPGYGGAAFDTTAVANYFAGRDIDGTYNVTANNSGLTVNDGYHNTPGGANCTPGAASVDDVVASSAARAQSALGADPSAASIAIRDTLYAPDEAGPGAGAYILSKEDLTAMVAVAIDRWKNAGVEGERLARLESLKVELSDLEAGQLVVTTPTEIIIDPTASEYGWFLDANSSGESEFEGRNDILRAKARSAAAGRMDLLTAITRAMGFVLEHENINRASYRHWYRDNTLLPSMRRVPSFNIEIPAPVRQYPLPSRDGNQISVTPGKADSQNSIARATELDVASPASAAIFNPAGFSLKDAASKAAFVPMSGETVTRNIGSIPAGKSVTITFRVTIDNPFPDGLCEVVNQGTVTADGGISLVTDDPDTGAPGDATRTTLPAAATITCPADITVNADNGLCSAVVTYSTTSTGCPVPTVVCSPASGSAFPKGATTVTCTASNNSGPDATCTFTVTVNDTQNPTITCPSNVSVQTSGSCEVVNYPAPTANDNCPGVAVVCSPPSGHCFPLGTTTVTCTATDTSNNTAQCTFTVHVMAVCSIACPASFTVGNDANQCGAVVTYPAPTPTGDCGAITCSPSSGSFFPVGTTTVNCSTGTGATCSFTVTVNDTQNPTITCPANITQPTTTGCAVVNYPAPTASDNCPGVAVVCSPPSGFCFNPGTTTVNCTATDAAGNTATCSFTVTVQDCAITCPANITVSNDPGQCGAAVNYPAASTTGTCGTVTCSPSSGTFFPKGTTTVTCTTQSGPKLLVYRHGQRHSAAFDYLPGELNGEY